MTDTVKLTTDHLIKQRERFAGKTVAQMDCMLPPGGRYAFNASQTVRRERLAEERYAARVLKLRTMLNITDEQLELIDLKGESNDGCGLVLALKTDREVENPKLG